jgi:hypothetical protein
MLSLACHKTTFHASSSACICDDACSYALCAACCRSARVRTCHARPSHIVHCSDIVGVPAKGSARSALVLCSCSCKRHALHVLRVRWCAQPGRALPHNSGAAIAKELGDFGARSDTKTKKCRGILEKGGSVFCPLVVCAGLARATFWGRFPAPLFSCVLSRGAQMWPLTVGFGVEDAHPFCRRRVAHCTNALSQPPRPPTASTPPKIALSQPRRPP